MTQMNFKQVDYSTLFTRIDDLDMSVRSLNCLINTIGLTYIGELAQKEAYELMKVQNFGRKCLYEVQEVLSKYGLRLGTKLSDWDGIRYQYEHNDILNLSSPQLVQLQTNADAKEYLTDESIDRKAFLNLFLKVSELPLSIRALNSFNTAQIEYVGDLVIRTECELLKTKNVGRKTVTRNKIDTFPYGINPRHEISCLVKRKHK